MRHSTMIYNVIIVQRKFQTSISNTALPIVASRKSTNVRRIGSWRKSRCSAVGTECLLFRRKRFHSDHRRKVQHGTMHSVPCRLFPPSCTFRSSRRTTSFRSSLYSSLFPLLWSLLWPPPSHPLPPTPFSVCLNRGAAGEKRRVCSACPKGWRDYQHTATYG